MLFVWKRTLAQIATIAGVLLTLALLGRAVLDIPWNLEWRREHIALFGIAFGIVLLSDFGTHAAVWRLLPSYRDSYAVLVGHFRGHRSAHFLAAGLAAATEELFFRGLVLEALREVLPTGVALVGSAVAFGIAHTAARRSLRIFGIFATWEGILLGGVYLASGSLLVSMLFHGVHDIGGYAFFATERRRGIWLR